MRVKRYVVDSMPDALQKIRSDLGKDAVILNTKEIRSGGFLGFFGKKKIEVIAAIDTAGGTNSQSKDAPVERRQLFAQTGTAQAVQQKEMSQAAQPAVKAYAKAANVAVIDQPMPFVPDVLPQGPLQTASDFVIIPEKPSLVKENVPKPSTISVKESAPAAKSKEDILLDELRQMKDMMNRLAKNAVSSNRPPELIRLEERLIDQEMHAPLVAHILQAVEERIADSEQPISYDKVHQLARKELEQIVKMDDKVQISPETSVIHFVGPTGVGKTTTIAKLAAEQVLKHRRKVGFITSDTYRIAAIEQLKTYASILNIPIEVVFSPNDLKKAFTELQDRDLIFMDTAGRNYRNELYVSELNALLQTKTGSETFLVLSMTTKYKDMKAITANFMNFEVNNVLFTKMDETDSYGPIANLMYDFKLKLSYLANGQNVPEDISIADPKHIIDHILGELGYE